MFRLPTAIAAASATALATVAFIASPASALIGTVSAAAFASACAAGPVTLAPSVKVEGGIASIPGGCTVNIPFDGAFEVVNASLTFGGSLVVNGTDKTKFEVVDSTVRAANVTTNMNAFETSVKVDKGSLQATAGSVNLHMGQISRVQIAYAGAAASLKASGAISIRGGDKLGVELNQSRVEAGSFSLAMSGPDGGVKAEDGSIVTTGAISIASTGSKALIETKGTLYRSGTATTVAFSGAESTVKASSARFESIGALTIAASENALGGNIELGGPGGVLRGSSVKVAASTTADKGGVKVSLTTLTATSGTLTIASGAMGATEVVEGSGTAATSATVSTGLGGVCKSDKSTFSPRSNPSASDP